MSARLDAVRRCFFSHFAIHTVYNTVDLYAVYAAIFVQNRVFFAYPPAVDALVMRLQRASTIQLVVVGVLLITHSRSDLRPATHRRQTAAVPGQNPGARQSYR